MNAGQLWVEIAQAALNFIVVNYLTNSAQGRTVMDMKTDLRTTKEDVLAEIKETEQKIIGILGEKIGNNDDRS